MFDFTSPKHGLELLEWVKRDNEKRDPHNRGEYRSSFHPKQLRDYEVLEWLAGRLAGNKLMDGMYIAALEYYCRTWINTV